MSDNQQSTLFPLHVSAKKTVAIVFDMMWFDLLLSVSDGILLLASLDAFS